jgi:hypothetical protein
MFIGGDVSDMRSIYWKTDQRMKSTAQLTVSGRVPVKVRQVKNRNLEQLEMKGAMSARLKQHLNEKNKHFQMIEAAPRSKDVALSCGRWRGKRPTAATS